jgi:hypothetical protein
VGADIRAAIMLKLPLWTVTEHVQTSDADPIPCDEPGKAVAFGSSTKLFAFLNSHLDGEWKMTMAADRDGLVIMIADLHRANIDTICLDPKVDGTGGEQVPLTDLMALADSLKGKE